MYLFIYTYILLQFVTSPSELNFSVRSILQAVQIIVQWTLNEVVMNDSRWEFM